MSIRDKLKDITEKESQYTAIATAERWIQTVSELAELGNSDEKKHAVALLKPVKDFLKSELKPITVMALVLFKLHKLGHRNVTEKDVKLSDFRDVGINPISECGQCRVEVAAYKAHPSKLGGWRCGECIDDDGFKTPEEAEEFSRGRRDVLK